MPSATRSVECFSAVEGLDPSTAPFVGGPLYPN
jgi:hypothetical protein